MGVVSCYNAKNFASSKNPENGAVVFSGNKFDVTSYL